MFKDLPSRAVKSCALSMVALTFHGVALAEYVSSVIMSGLHNPRGVAIGPDGGIYVAEAGLAGVTGGPVSVIGNNTRVYSQTGSISRYSDGAQQQVVSNLASVQSSVFGVLGPNGIAFDATGTGYVAIGLGGDPNIRTSGLAPVGVNLAQIVRLGTPPTNFADVGAFEASANPGGGPLDTQPFHLAAHAGGLLVTDAGGNSLVNVNPAGAVSLVAAFPARNAGGTTLIESVPTGVAVGPDGAIYMGELTGGPHIVGAARVYRIAAGQAPTIFATGFTNITDIAFGRDGSLYVLEYDTNGIAAPGSVGALIRLAPDGTRSTLFSEGLVNPTGLAIGSDGAFYVSNFSSSATAGQVLRIVAVPEPGSVALVALGLAGFGRAARRCVQKR